jgi:ubiquitin-conjugating enzyme E2 variant
MLVDPSLPFLTRCSDLVPDISEQSVHENRIYSVNIHCGDDYPDAPPTIQFVSKVNLPCVDPRTGKVSSASHGLSREHFTDNTSQVDPSRVPCLAQWKRDFTMETILVELRK